MRTLEEIYEIAQLMLKPGASGRVAIPREEVEAWVLDQTQQLGGTRKGLDELRVALGESVTQKIMTDPLGSAKTAVDFLVKANDFLGTVSVKDVGMLAASIPKAMVQALAGDVDPETGFRDPETGGFTALAEAGMAVGEFIVDDFARFGPGAFIDFPAGGASAGAGFLRRGLGKVDEAGKVVGKITNRADDIARLKRDFGLDEAAANRVLDSKIKHDADVAAKLAAGDAPIVRASDTPVDRAAELRAVREGELAQLDDGSIVTNEFAETKARLEAGRGPERAFEPSGKVVEVEGVGQVSEEMAESLARQQARPIPEVPIRPPNVAAGRGLANRPPIDPELPVLERIAQVRRNRMASLDLEDVPIPRVDKVDVPYHKKWADIYSRADNEINPRTQEAWEAMVREAEDQHKWLTARPEDGGAGIRFTMVDEDPYTSAAQMVKELEETGGIRVFRTPDDFGHPLMTPEQNDIFRSVHDMKHAEMGSDFSIKGETETAWRHLAEFSPEARRAVAVETLGQNSAYKYGHQKGFQEQRVFDVQDERLFSVGYENIDDVPSVIIPERDLPLPFEGAAGEVSDDLAEAALRINDETGGTTIRIGDAENLAKRDLWTSSIGKKYERLAPEGEGFTPQQVADFMDETLEYRLAHPDAVFGMWNDRVRPGYAESFDHGRQEMNLTRTFDNMSDARNYALDNDQAAIMNLADDTFDAVSPHDANGLAALRTRLDNNVDSRNARRWANFRKFTRPEELQAFYKTPTGRNRATDVQARILDSFSLSPQPRDAAAAALVGHEVGRYYQSSARPLAEMFGTDAPRIFALHSGLSPNAPVMSDLGATIDIWGDWIEAGRPSSREAMKGWLDAGKVKWGVTPTNLNNMERVLTVPEARLLEPGILDNLVRGEPKGKGLQAGRSLLSGKKVNPFAANYMGELQRFTMDTHMTNWFFPNHKGNAINFTEAVGGEVAARMAAEYLTEVTGVPWAPAEFQAAGWGTVKTLKELSKRRGFKDLPEMMEAMGLTDAGMSTPQSASNFAELQEAIRSAPNAVSQMLSDPQLQPGLERLKRLGAIQGDIPTFKNDLDKLPDFLADPQVRKGDLMDMVRRLVQSKEQLPGVIALLVGQGIMDHEQGREAMESLAEEVGLGGFGVAFDRNPSGTMQMLMLLGEQPDLDDHALSRFGDAVGIGQAPDLIRTLRGSTADPEPAGRPSNIQRFGQKILRPDPVNLVVPAPPIPRPLF